MDAPEKASGKTRYIHDIDLPGQLYGKILRSARVHARIISIDTSAAKALAGVHAVITAADVPWQRPIGVGKDHLPLKTDRCAACATRSPRWPPTARRSPRRR